MEFGASTRQPHANTIATEDTDTSPTWRLIGAWIWHADCVQDHVLDVARSSILTTHLLAVAMLSRKDIDVLSALSFGHADANAAIEAMVSNGDLAAAHDAVRLMSGESRRLAVGEAVAVVMKGYTGLQLDIVGQYHRR